MKFITKKIDALTLASRQAKGLNADHYVSPAEGGYWVASHAPSEGAVYSIVHPSGEVVNILGQLF